MDLFAEDWQVAVSKEWVGVRTAKTEEGRYPRHLKCS